MMTNWLREALAIAAKWERKNKEFVKRFRENNRDH
jgi:hypothetical protein